MGRKKKQQPRKPQPEFRLRRAQGAGQCARCPGLYAKGEMVAGRTGHWVHAFHLAGEQERAAWAARVGGQIKPERPVLGGAWESKRRKH